MFRSAFWNFKLGPIRENHRYYYSSIRLFNVHCPVGNYMERMPLTCTHCELTVRYLPLLRPSYISYGTDLPCSIISLTCRTRCFSYLLLTYLSGLYVLRPKNKKDRPSNVLKQRSLRNTSTVEVNLKDRGILIRVCIVLLVSVEHLSFRNNKKRIK